MFRQRPGNRFNGTHTGPSGPTNSVYDVNLDDGGESRERTATADGIVGSRLSGGRLVKSVFTGCDRWSAPAIRCWRTEGEIAMAVMINPAPARSRCPAKQLAGHAAEFGQTAPGVLPVVLSRIIIRAVIHLRQPYESVASECPTPSLPHDQQKIGSGASAEPPQRHSFRKAA